MNAMIRIWVMFLCFQRRHYNKAPLVWLSNTWHWKDKHQELYEQFCMWPPIFDEYPVENTHSIIRAQTKPSDTSSKLQQRAKSIFQSKAKQTNFRSTFTPAKPFSFSQKQVNFLKVKCAELLTNIFTAINKNLGAASTVIRRKKKYIHLPHLFGQDAAKYKVLPLGFHACQEPNQDCRCDLKSCTVTNGDEPWKLFSGCWHSFHDTCLNGSPFCPICQKLLETKTKELGATAKEAIFNTTPSTSTIETDIEPDDDSSMPETLPSEDSHKCDETVKSLHKRIEDLMPSPKPTYHHQQSEASVALNPHVTSTKQPQSSSNELEPLNEIQNAYHETQQQSPPVNGFSTRLLPWDICQINITGRPKPSNACTIIASLWCRKFLKKNISISGCTHGRFDDVTSSYKQTIQTGNMLYNNFNLPAHQPNLEVCDVVNKIPDLTLKILNDVGFFDGQTMSHSRTKL